MTDKREQKNSPSGKKPYQKPKLTKHGNIRELTLSGASVGADHGGKKAAGT